MSRGVSSSSNKESNRLREHTEPHRECRELSRPDDPQRPEVPKSLPFRLPSWTFQPGGPSPTRKTRRPSSLLTRT